MGKVEEYKPVMAMIGLQLCYAGVTLSSRATLVHGTSPRVFILYRQALATICIFPFLYFSRRKSKISPLDLKSFSLIFMVSLIGITINQNLYFEGLYLASSSMGSAMGNINPAVTFLISFLVGYEKVNIKNIRGLAKIAGTVLCVVGAISMTLLRGPKILNSESALSLASSLLGGLKDQNMWLIGCLFLFSSNLCWSFWLTLQVPISAYYPDHVSLSAWMCLFGTIQCAVVTFFLEKDPNAWILHSYSEFATCLYAGVVASALSFTVQAGLIGGLCVIMGLYIVLWGKSKDVMKNQEQRDSRNNSEVKIHIEDSSNTTNCNKDLENPLLSKHKSTEEIQNINN
ncbi:WAT1-related protein At4g30420-like [Raphanus sativus]|uniref:WAT1-related protein n=1 Tax=Raphanus sativus TaxID=3726 RepID=A0A9W3CKF8_RAPSA|nr:WAT1-related protein At4g30420-like [Raphanus sativus]